MTEVSFHFNVPDRTEYTCRLLRKATRQGAKVVVTGTGAVLSSLDRALWAFDPTEFVPHALLRHAQPMPARLADTPVWLLEDSAAAVHHDVLLNLGHEAPVGFESFSRLIEIVSADEDDRAAARARWKHYANRGYTIVRHEVAP
ncbi:MAG: DNA polymerase III subunit chi [Burkholderiales bacterium]